ncbi:DUF4402 domain-containing protein [uncultured Erythrobacter sp.]|uniref:DUF4402 domain-containing protein n=1 Tax=uncultured Erythrobacter sp. TaxID=263913 RepID=UPI002608CD5A|nr:DUF4402 domain-containing protein [uncultured Erythrobacter sp.]
MTKIIRSAAAGVALFAAMGLGSAAHAQVSESADARAEVLAALQLTNDADLDFGALVLNAGSAGGSVTVDSTGFRDCFGDVICGPGGTEQASTFTVTGAANTNVLVSVQDLFTNPVSLTHTGFAGSPNAEHNIELTGLDDGSFGGFFGFSGSESFNVGGTIDLDGSEVAGTYVGSFDVTVEYQ